VKWPFGKYRRGEFLEIRFLEEIGFLLPKDEMLARHGKLQ
jgi:hypothetical protein